MADQPGVPVVDGAGSAGFPPAEVVVLHPDPPGNPAEILTTAELAFELEGRVLAPMDAGEEIQRDTLTSGILTEAIERLRVLSVPMSPPPGPWRSLTTSVIYTLVEELQRARAHVYRQRHHGKHEQDREDAAEWLARYDALRQELQVVT